MVWHPSPDERAAAGVAARIIGVARFDGCEGACTAGEQQEGAAFSSTSRRHREICCTANQRSEGPASARRLQFRTESTRRRLRGSSNNWGYVWMLLASRLSGQSVDDVTSHNQLASGRCIKTLASKPENARTLRRN